MNYAYRDFIRKLQVALLSGNATEITHYPPLQDLIESLEAKIRATNEPKQIADRGTSGLAFYQGSLLMGYVETKPAGVNLDSGERSP